MRRLRAPYFGAPGARVAIGFGARDRDRLALSLHLLLSRLGRCRLAVLSRAPRGGARPAVRRSMPVARIWSRLLGSHRPHHCVWRPFESQLAPTTTPHPLPAEFAHERYGDDIFEPRVTGDACQHLERLVLHSQSISSPRRRSVARCGIQPRCSTQRNNCRSPAAAYRHDLGCQRSRRCMASRGAAARYFLTLSTVSTGILTQTPRVLPPLRVLSGPRRTARHRILNYGFRAVEHSPAPDTGTPISPRGANLQHVHWTWSRWATATRRATSTSCPQ